MTYRFPTFPTFPTSLPSVFFLYYNIYIILYIIYDTDIYVWERVCVLFGVWCYVLVWWCVQKKIPYMSFFFVAYMGLCVRVCVCKRCIIGCFGILLFLIRRIVQTSRNGIPVRRCKVVFFVMVLNQCFS